MWSRRLAGTISRPVALIARCKHAASPEVPLSRSSIQRPSTNSITPRVHLIDDKPLVFDDPENEMRWKPNNAGESFRGEIPMRTCLQDSINTPAIRIAQAVGIRDILRNARRLGIRTPLKKELAQPWEVPVQH